MKYNKKSSSYSVLHETDQKRIASLYAGSHCDSHKSDSLVSILIFVLSTWLVVFLSYDYVYPKVSGTIELKNLPYYIGLLGIWVLYTVNYSYFFLKKMQGLISKRFSSVGMALMIQSFVYGVMASAIAVKEYRVSETSSISELITLRIPLIDNPLNILSATVILFVVGAAITFFSLPAKSASSRESIDKLMIVIATTAIYVLTVLYNVITEGWISEFLITGAIYTSVIILGVAPYFYANAIICGAKSSKTLNGGYYSMVLGGLFMVLLISSYALTKDLFILMYKHDAIDLMNFSLIFIAAILSVAFTRVMMYPRLIQEFNSDVIQTKRINESNKGIMNDDFIPEDDFEDGIEEPLSDDDDLSENTKYESSTPKASKNSEVSHSFQTDNDMDGLMDDYYDDGDGLFEDDGLVEDDGLMEDEDPSPRK